MSRQPTVRTEAIIDRIIERVSAGEYLAAICRDIGVGLRTVYDWRDEDAQFAARLARAREEGEEAIALNAVEAIDAPAAMTATQFGDKVDPGDVALRKLRFDAKLKMLAVWNPRKWGEKRQLEHSGKIGLESLVAGEPDAE